MRISTFFSSQCEPARVSYIGICRGGPRAGFKASTDMSMARGCGDRSYDCRIFQLTADQLLYLGAICQNRRIDLMNPRGLMIPLLLFTRAAIIGWTTVSAVPLGILWTLSRVSWNAWARRCEHQSTRYAIGHVSVSRLRSRRGRMDSIRGILARRVGLSATSSSGAK